MCMLITCTIHLHCQMLEKKMYGLLFCSWVQSCTGIASLGFGSTVGLAKKAQNWMRQQKTLLFKTFQWQVNCWCQQICGIKGMSTGSATIPPLQTTTQHALLANFAMWCKRLLLSIWLTFSSKVFLFTEREMSDHFSICKLVYRSLQTFELVTPWGLDQKRVAIGNHVHHLLFRGHPCSIALHQSLALNRLALYWKKKTRKNEYILLICSFVVMKTQLCVEPQQRKTKLHGYCSFHLHLELRNLKPLHFVEYLDRSRSSLS